MTADPPASSHVEIRRRLATVTFPVTIVFFTTVFPTAEIWQVLSRILHQVTSQWSTSFLQDQTHCSGSHSTGYRLFQRVGKIQHNWSKWHLGSELGSQLQQLSLACDNSLRFCTRHLVSQRGHPWLTKPTRVTCHNRFLPLWLHGCRRTEISCPTTRETLLAQSSHHRPLG